MWTTFSGSVRMPLGVRRLMASSCSGRRTEDISDSKKPGQMLLTWILRAPTSLAREREKASSAPLEAE